MAQENNQIQKSAPGSLKVSDKFSDLIMVISTFFLGCHIIGCLWIVTANMSYDEKFEYQDSKYKNNWINNDKYNQYTARQLYIAAYYYTVTTVTTVGYGDITGTNSGEKIFCMILMVSGVVFFSIVSGYLA